MDLSVYASIFIFLLRFWYALICAKIITFASFIRLYSSGSSCALAFEVMNLRGVLSTLS